MVNVTFSTRLSSNLSQAVTNEGGLPPSGLIAEDQKRIVEMFVVVSALFISCGGTVTNAINIRTFIKMGLQDSNTLSLFHLALSDYAMCVSSAVCIAAFACQQVEIWDSYQFDFDPTIITVYFSNFGEMFYLSTTMTTTYIAVVRCFCVAKPLHFKNTFTVIKTIFSLVFIDLFTVGNFLPILLAFETKVQFEPLYNASRPKLWLSETRDISQDVKSAIVDIASSVVSQVVVVICLVVMMVKLQQAAKFRQLSQQHAVKELGIKMSLTNVQVLQQVVILSALFVMCNIPKILIALVRLTVPDFDAGKRFGSLYNITYEFRLIIETLSSAVNLFIYLSFNSKFRQALGCGK